MSLELPDFVGSARHAGTFAFHFLCKEEKQNKTKVLVYHWTQHRKTCTMDPKLPHLGKLSKAVSAGEESSSNPTKATFLPLPVAGRHSCGGRWFSGFVNPQASQGRKAVRVP